MKGAPKLSRLSQKLTPEDSARLAKWIDKHGYDGAAKKLGVSPTSIQKLAHDGSAMPASVKRMSDVLRIAEQLDETAKSKKNE